jgi:hypothetical protein
VLILVLVLVTLLQPPALPKINYLILINFKIAGNYKLNTASKGKSGIRYF